ncbi:hypothetical protein JHK87_055146 [Glycine soja]|nr:hypothetical protein JHK87_055146 [Glycine soja]
MDFTAEKKESESNTENAHPTTLDSSSQLASALDSNNKEIEERQARELKAGIHPLKVWSMDGLSDNMTMPINLKAKFVVAAHDKDINSVVVAPNDSLVCSGSQRLPNLVSVIVFKGHKRGIWSVEFSPVDQCVVTASGDKTIRIWAISDGSCLKTFEGHTSSVLRALFVTCGTQIVSCGMRLSVADFVLYNILVVEKARIRRIIEAEGIPYTYLCCHAFTDYFLRNLA